MGYPSFTLEDFHDQVSFVMYCVGVVSIARLLHYRLGYSLCSALQILKHKASCATCTMLSL